jgi:HEAT repeat protein
MRRTSVSPVLLMPVLLMLLATLVTGCSQAQAPKRPATSAPAAPAAAAPAAPATPTLDALVEKLRTTADSRDRVLVIDEIATLGQNAKPALAVLVKATEDPELRVRWHAARAIGLIGEDASTAVPVLVKLLADPDPVVAAQAAAAIGNVRGDEDAATISAEDAARYTAAQEAVASATVHPDPRVRRAAIRALRHLSPSPAVLGPLFAKQLADADPSVVLPALHTLATLEEAAVPVLVEALKNPKARYWACIGLAEIGEEAAAATDALATVVKDGEIDERLQAILALAAIGAKAAPAAPVLVAALESPDKSLRFPAAYALGKICAVTADAALEKVAAEDDEVLAATAAWALAQTHRGEKPFADAALARLLKLLEDEDPGVREGAVAGLSDLAAQLDDEQKKQLATRFVGLITDVHPEVGLAAGAALIRLGPASLGPLRGKLADPAVRTHVLEILAGIGPAAKPALDDIVKELDDADPDHAGEAAVAIGAIGPEAAAVAAPRLRRVVADAGKPAGLRYAAAYALGRLGPAAKEAEPDLRKLAETDDEMMATVAIWAALKVAPEDKSLFERAVPLLRRALRGDREMVRLEAAVALGDIGSAAATAIPMLELVAEDDPVKPVRAAAAEALKKIRP